MENLRHCSIINQSLVIKIFVMIFLLVKAYIDRTPVFIGKSTQKSNKSFNIHFFHQLTLGQIYFYTFSNYFCWLFYSRKKVLLFLSPPVFATGPNRNILPHLTRFQPKAENPTVKLMIIIWF